MAAALFDLDGVIIDTEPSYSLFWGRMGRKYNVPVEDFANVIKGTTLTNILSTYFPDPEVQKLVVKELEEHEQKMEYYLFRDTITALEQYKAAGIPCAIVTSSNLDKMANLWAQHPGLKDYFSAIITDEDVTQSKPDPQPYLIAAERLGEKPENTFVFEDSFNGLLSGRRAGAIVVGLATTNPATSLYGKADIVIHALTDIRPEFLLSILDKGDRHPKA